METKRKSVSILIPVYKPDLKLDMLLHRLLEQTVCPDKIILLHTLAYEGEKLELKEDFMEKVEIHQILKKDFDHGGTRRYGASLVKTDYFVCMTQDALPDNNLLIEKLLDAFSDDQVAVSYARQLPIKEATIMERFTRSFNYPAVSRMQTKSDIETLGIKTFFCSDVCAAYRVDRYHELGGFVKRTIFNEDMIFAFDVIYSDYKVAYVSDARVIHSHNYTYLQQLHRNFDLGVSHNEYDYLFDHIKTENEGIKMVKKMLSYAVKRKKYYLIPDIVLSNAFKYIGYQLGKHYTMLPRKIVQSLCMNKSYFA